MFKPGQELCEKDPFGKNLDRRKIRLIKKLDNNNTWACHHLSGTPIPGQDNYRDSDPTEPNVKIPESDLEKYFEPC
jgi:hypothetical protein